MIGLGCQEDCKTNGAGPARYKKCATGVVYEGKKKAFIDHCDTGFSPSTLLDPCIALYYRALKDDNVGLKEEVRYYPQPFNR